MGKVKSSSLFTRQIPENIRTEYPLFVEFIKAYYQFLQDSQGQQLESIRDVNTTLDAFVEKFKNEVAKDIPINMTDDPREFLRHVREFYLSRGSEASFKFLFKTLFKKEAEIIYPSKQILRVSDGKWKQDVSCFLIPEATSGTNPNTGNRDLFKFNRGFATITTSKKSFITYVERVQLYDAETYELFIQRDYSDEIEVGSIFSIEVDGITYSGVVQKCPNKLTITKPGKNFKVGDIFFLKTDRGRGCEIKITKVGTNGEIRDMQVVAFGLDYDNTFYSYLSAEYDSAWEYYHPISELIRNGSVYFSSPGYEEKSTGFIEYGYAYRQSYMSYDGLYGAEGNKNFFVAGDYVAEAASQFYEDNTNRESIEDLDSIALITIELGATAKYPGYYETQDGFISDEMYIHDGSYYQVYSYIIKVEEQLEKYRDLIKNLLHPAGMKYFAEYSIHRDLVVSFEEKIFKKLFALSSFISMTDEGTQYTYTEWDLNYGEDGRFSYASPALGSPIYAVNKPYKVEIKTLYTTVNLEEDFSRTFVLDKFTSILPIPTDVSYNSFTKNHNTDYITALQSSASFINSRIFLDTAPITELVGKAFASPPVQDDTYSSDDSSNSFNKDANDTSVASDELNDKVILRYNYDYAVLSETVGKNLNRSNIDSFVGISDVNNWTFEPKYYSYSSTSDTDLYSFNKHLQSALAPTDEFDRVVDAKRFLASAINIVDPGKNFDVSRAFDDNTTADSLYSFFKPFFFTDVSTLADDNSLNYGLNPLDIASAIETAFGRRPYKNIDDSITSSEYLRWIRDFNIVDSVSIPDLIGKSFPIERYDNITLLEFIGALFFVKGFDDTITTGEAFIFARGIIADPDFINIFDNYESEFKFGKQETITLADLRDPIPVDKGLTETINNDDYGQITFNPYSIQGYFAETGSIQSGTTFT